MESIEGLEKGGGGVGKPRPSSIKLVEMHGLLAVHSVNPKTRRVHVPLVARRSTKFRETVDGRASIFGTMTGN